MKCSNAKTAIMMILAAILVAACAGCHTGAYAPEDASPNSSATGLRTFALAGDFPSDIVIPDIDGMRSTAFVVSAQDPSGVIAIDIDANPMKPSAVFRGVTVPEDAGIPLRLVIATRSQGFLLNSNAVVSFNPETGAVLDLTSVVAPLAIGGGHLNSDSSTANTWLNPSDPGGIAIAGDKLFVSSSNYLHTQPPAIAAPGTVQVFTINANGSLTPSNRFITSGYNPTGLAVRNDNELLVLNSGIIESAGAKNVAQSDASIDVLDLGMLTITSTVPLGKVAASPWGLALTIDGSRAFIGSAAFGHIYEVDLIKRQVLRGADHPIAVSDGADHVLALALSVDDQYLFASSFKQNSVLPFDLTASDPALGNAYMVGFPSGVTNDNPSGANTGAGPLAVRPGSRGMDYSGEDLFVLTGYPGTLVAITTDASAQRHTPPALPAPDNNTAPPTTPPSGNKVAPCQGFAEAVHTVTYGPGAGFGQGFLPNIVLGPPHGAGALSGGLDVLSLGTGGEIVLDLENCPVVDGPGKDFIVFENAFLIGGNPATPYAEPATVGVSDDGITFTDFPCSLAVYPYQGCAGCHPVYSNPNNNISPFDPLAAGGEAYDLHDISIAHARFVRVRDGGVCCAGITTAGFDLDAIAVIHGETNN
ncbi:MAG: hypothetical protein V2A66_03015 [Pseudomonadota bacterium]